LVTSVRGSGALPITAESEALGVIAFMKAALGLRLTPDFFLGDFFAGFFAAAFFAGFLAAAFFGADFFMDFFADFFAAVFFFAAIVVPPI
jgi:hypothetical protein